MQWQRWWTATVLIAVPMALGVASGAAGTPAQHHVDSARVGLSRPWVGRLQKAANDRGYVDGSGAFVLPLCRHFGEAFSAFTRRPADVERQLRAIKDAGYDCIRFWDHLGEYSAAWRDKEVSPWSWTNGDGVRVSATPEYFAKAEAFVIATERAGLALDHSGGDFGRQRSNFPVSQIVAMREQWAQIYDRRGWHNIALGEAINEAWQNGGLAPADLLRIVDPFKARGAIVGLSAPPDASEDAAGLNAFSQGASVYIVHGYRLGEPSDRLRHIFSIPYDKQPEKRLGWQTEPTGPGPGVTVGRVDDVEELALLAAQAWAARQAWTMMSGCGVFWTCALESEPGHYAVPRMRSVLRGFSPDLMAWPLLTHGGRGDAPLRSTTGYFGDAGVTRGPARINITAHASGRKYVAIVSGGRGPRELRNHLPCTADITLVHAQADETIAQQRLAVGAGQTFPLDYRVGRLVLGQCQTSKSTGHTDMDDMDLIIDGAKALGPRTTDF